MISFLRSIAKVPSLATFVLNEIAPYNKDFEVVSATTSRLMPSDVDGKYEVIQWLMFQVGGIGPMQGQATALKRCSAGADPAQTRRGGSTPTCNSVQEGQWGRCYAEGGRET